MKQRRIAAAAVALMAHFSYSVVFLQLATSGAAVVSPFFLSLLPTTLNKERAVVVTQSPISVYKLAVIMIAVASVQDECASFSIIFRFGLRASKPVESRRALLS